MDIFPKNTHIILAQGEIFIPHGTDEDPSNSKISGAIIRGFTAKGGFGYRTALVERLHNHNGPNAGSAPSYIELDARLGCNATKRLEFSMVGRNLLHNHHPEYGFPGPTRKEIERSVQGKVAWYY
jgi:hypothetical protein